MTVLESSRYARQIALPEIGKDGQLKIRNSKVFIVGCGALGSMVAMQLAGAGIGEIGIADFDTIDITNLQRQFFFKDIEAGESKSVVLNKRINELNPDVDVKLFNEFVSKNNFTGLIADYDIVIDATDNPDSKKMIDDGCLILNKPCIIAGVSGFKGQVMTIMPDDIRFNEIFPETEEEGFLPCSLGCVSGPVAALCASIQVSEALKIILNIGETLSNKLLIFNLLNNKFEIFNLK